MCILCYANRNSGFQATEVAPVSQGPQYGQGTTSGATATGTQNIDGLLSGFRWATTTLTFAMPATAAAYPEYNAAVDETGTFSAVTGNLATTVQAVMNHISQYTGLTITQIADGTVANIRVGRTSDASTAYAYLPDGSGFGGDIWIGLGADFNSPVRGSYGWATILHETGHALGLKHSHTYIGGIGLVCDNVGVTSMPVTAAQDSLEYTVMSYRSYANQDLYAFDYYTNEAASYPQTLMMLDIAALQAMYGADFGTNSTNTVYTFSTTTGQMSINGASEGAVAGNRIFRTVWDGGGIDTYDFSNYATNLQVDLAPGSSSLLSTAQRADLGNGNFAAGNIYNALLYQNDLRSLIENAVGGSGNDTLMGNQAANQLQGGAGNDQLDGGVGNDNLIGDAGNDFLTGGTGDDVLNGGADFDYADYLAATSGVTVSLAITAAQAVGGGLGTDTLTSIEAIYGSQFGDVLTGDGGTSNALFGNGGADSIIGNGGFDFVDAGDGDDTIDGGTGNDYLLGGTGTDTVTFANASAAVYVDMSGASAFANGTATGFDVLASVERIIGSGFGDFLFGSAGADTLTGGAGVDIIYGFGLGDSLDGGNDSDYLVGGLGADIITTGAGQDYIYFQGQAEGKDTVTDWRTNGFDLLVIDEPSFGGGLIAGQYLSSESWRFVTGTAANAAFGQFLWNSATSTLSWDADGTGAGAAVQLVTLTGITTLTAADILVL
jgi:serralysin